MRTYDAIVMPHRPQARIAVAVALSSNSVIASSSITASSMIAITWRISGWLALRSKADNTRARAPILDDISLEETYSPRDPQTYRARMSAIRFSSQLNAPPHTGTTPL
jgi:hypothetical protein